MPATVIYLLTNGIEASAWSRDSDFSRIYHIPSFINAARHERTALTISKLEKANDSS